MKTVFDILSIDLKALPNRDCVQSGKRTNSSGLEITEYTGVLPTEELGLFKMVKILVFPDGSKNVALFNANLESIRVPALEKLVITLFSLYGPDSNVARQGAFTSEDQRSVKSVIADPSNGFWIGRLWSDLGVMQ